MPNDQISLFLGSFWAIRTLPRLTHDPKALQRPQRTEQHSGQSKLWSWISCTIHRYPASFALFLSQSLQFLAVADWFYTRTNLHLLLRSRILVAKIHPRLWFYCKTSYECSSSLDSWQKLFSPCENLEVSIQILAGHIMLEEQSTPSFSSDQLSKSMDVDHYKYYHYRRNVSRPRT